MALEVFHNFLGVFTINWKTLSIPQKGETTQKSYFVKSLKPVKIDKNRKYTYLGKPEHHPEDGMALYCVL